MKIYQLELFNNFENLVEDTNKKDALEKKIKRAIKLIQSASKNNNFEPIEVCYSGGKDSDVILELVKMAKVKYVAIYKNTTIDPKGTIKHCKEKGVKIVNKKSFAEVIQKKGFPTFVRRFCCKEIKEYKILNVAVQGIRKCESIKREKRYKEPTMCRFYNKKERVEVILPILTWSDNDIKDFIEMRNIECHPLYYKDGKFNVKCRLGCIGCPQKSDRGLADFKANPKWVLFWLKNGEIWWNTHNLKKTKKKFNSIYELFVRNLFFNSYEDFKMATEGMFGKIDCKEFLEKYFKIQIRASFPSAKYPSEASMMRCCNTALKKPRKTK